MSLENFPSFLLNFSESEMSGEAKHFYRFKSFRLYVEERQLLNNGKAVPLTPKVFEVLAALVERNGHLVEKDELLRLVWADSFVEEANVARIVHTLRKVLGEDDNGNKFIETVAKKGYRFVAKVNEVREPTANKSANGKQDFLSVAENFSETIIAEKISENELQIPLSLTESDETVAPLVIKPKQKTRIILFTVGFLSAVFLILLLSFNFQSESSSHPNNVKSIAVLPLKPINTNNRDEIYEIGIADSLIYTLGSMKGFVVRPLSAIRKYADIEQDAMTAGREQQVDYVLASNYQLAGGKIKITAQLVNVASGQIEETYKIEKEAGDIFALQDEIAGEVGSKLLARFATTSSNPTAKRGTTSEEAYRLYLQGMYLVEKMGFDNAKRSIELFDEALLLDPNYAQAWAGKARAHCYFSHVGGNSPDEQYTKAKPAIERAFALDPNLPEAHAVLGVIKIDYDWNFADGEKQFLRAIEIAPTCEIAHRWYANRLAGQGRSEEAIARIKAAIDLNPNYVYNQILYGRALYFARRYDEAITQLQRAVEMDSADPGVYNSLWRSYQMNGDYPRAYESFMKFQQLIKTKDEVLGSYETAYTKRGWQGVLLRRLEILKANAATGSDAYDLAVMSALLGQRDQSLLYLDDAVKNRSAAIPDIIGNPGLDSLRDDPRFDELVRRVGLK